MAYLTAACATVEALEQPEAITLGMGATDGPYSLLREDSVATQQPGTKLTIISGMFREPNCYKSTYAAAMPSNMKGAMLSWHSGL